MTAKELDCCHEGWAHFNEFTLSNGHIVSDIECCGECGHLENDDEALAKHDATCLVCRPLNKEDEKAILDVEVEKRTAGSRTYGDDPEHFMYLRITKTPRTEYLP